MRFESLVFRSTSRPAQSTWSSCSHVDHVLQTDSIWSRSIEWTSINLTILFDSLFFLLSLQLQLSLNLLTDFVNIFYSPFFALRSIAESFITRFASLLLRCGRLLLLVMVSFWLWSGLPILFLTLLSKRGTSCSSELIHKILHAFVISFLLSSLCLSENFLGISKVLFRRKNLVDGHGWFVNINMLGY